MGNWSLEGGQTKKTTLVALQAKQPFQFFLQQLHVRKLKGPQNG